MNNRLKNTFALTLLALGTVLFAQGGYIKLKAQAADWLIASSWAGSKPNAVPTKPWPWADTWVIARLRVPRLGVNQFIMKDASGESLAFGPGSSIHNALPASGKPSLIAGHRDTHFKFLADLVAGDRIEVENHLGQRQSYLVVDTKLFDTRTGPLQLDAEDAGLTLATCWPFDAIVPGGPLRYLVYALPVNPEESVYAENTPRTVSQL